MLICTYVNMDLASLEICQFVLLVSICIEVWVEGASLLLWLDICGSAKVVGATGLFFDTNCQELSMLLNETAVMRQ